MKLKWARTAVAVTLALASGAACALGLGQIEVKSRFDQPLLAEIPVLSSDPGELEQLQARLASPETFARIGLTPPDGVVSDLQFTVALDVRGNPVIRVTSSQPVKQPLLTFLLEVDWGQGRLVREYSALVDAPRTVSAPNQPPIQSAVGGPSNTIERPAAPVAAAPAPAPTDPAAKPEAKPAAVTPAAPADRPIAQNDPAPRPAPPPRPASISAGEDFNVRRGDTLSGIASRLEREGQTLNQAMIALLRANPDAFIGGNINRLRAGVVLRVPPANELVAVDSREASELVRVQIQQWRDARNPAAQPAVDTAVAKAPPAPAEPASGTKPADGGRATAGARLEIVPPGAGTAKAGTQSGISAGGEGKMLQQELQQANEAVASHEAEVQELKSRLVELEQLRDKQQKLIQIKDAELASTQQRLAQAQHQADNAGGSLLPWLFAGIGLLLIGGGGWFFVRRGNRSAAPVLRGARPSPLDMGPIAPIPVADHFHAPAPEQPRAPEPPPQPEPVFAHDHPNHDPLRTQGPGSFPAAAGLPPAPHLPPAAPTPDPYDLRAQPPLRAVDSKLLDSRPRPLVEPRPSPLPLAAEARTPELKPVEARVPDVRPFDPRSAERSAESGRPHDVRPLVESRGAEAAPAEHRPQDLRTPEAPRSYEARSYEARPLVEPLSSEAKLPPTSVPDLRPAPVAPPTYTEPVSPLGGSGSGAKPAPLRPVRNEPDPLPPSRKSPPWHAANPAPAAAAPAVAAPAPAPNVAATANAAARSEPLRSSLPGQERIELARAYLDLGDQDSARQLLGEILITGDHAARQQAARMLRELE